MKRNASETAKNTAIYNELATIGRQVFKQMTGTDEGKIYTPADIARAITGGPVMSFINGSYICERVEPFQLGGGFKWADGFDPATAYTVTVDGFSCRVIAWKIFDVLDRAARSLNIPTAARVTFERPRAAAPVVVSFSLSTTTARELAACCAADLQRPILGGVQLDTVRRVLVASDGQILRVVQLGDALTVDESAAASYIIPADVLKSGRVVTIDANGIVSTDKKSAPAIAGRFPNWAGVIPAVSDAGRVPLTADLWKQLKKAVATVAAVHPKRKYNNVRRVVIAHDFLSDVLHVWALDLDFNKEKDVTVPVSNVREKFSISFNADDFARIGGTPTALYLRDQCRAIVTTDAAGLSVVMPKRPEEDDKYYYNFDFYGDAADLLPGLDIADAAADIAEKNTAAAALEIVEKVRQECKGKTAEKMLKYMNERFGHSQCLDRARQLLRDQIAAESAATNETPAAPAADQMTAAAPLTLPPLAALLTSNDAPAQTLPAPSPRPVRLLPLLPSNGTANETPDTNESNRPAVVIAANFTRRARRWFQVAATVLYIIICAAAPVVITTNESDTPAPELLTITPDTLTATNESADTITNGGAAPAADQMTADTLGTREIKRETPRPRRHHHRATVAAPVVITPDTLAADTITPDTLGADTLGGAVPIVPDTLQAARNITDTADTLTADTLETARDITAAPAAADIESDTDDETPAPVVITPDESDDETSAADPDETSEDDENGTTSPTSSTTSTTGGTNTTSTTTTAPASVVIIGPAPAWSLIL